MKVAAAFAFLQHLKTVHCIFFQGSTVQVGSLKMQINGEVTVNDCLDITGRFYYYGSGFKVTEARLSHKLKITGAQNYFDVIVTSDHPSLPEARFAVTAEVLSQVQSLTTYMIARRNTIIACSI